MKNAMKKAVGLLMTAALLMSVLLQTGCSREAKDVAAVKDTVEQFIETFAKGDSDDVEDLIDGDFSYGYSDKDAAELLLKMASKTKIESFKSVEIDRQKMTAKARFKISYINVYEFARAHDYDYLSKDEYAKAISSYKDLSKENFSFNLVFDKEKGCWLIKEASAEKYKELFERENWITLATISPEEARTAFEGIIGGLAQGNIDQPYYSFDMEDIMIFDDNYPHDPVVYEAALEFTKAYYSYVEDHGYSVDIPADYPYRALISGYVPSKKGILTYISSDEYMTEMCKAIIRDSYGTSNLSEEEIWNQFYAGIYYDLAEKIPNIAGEEYVVIFQIDNTIQNPKIYTYDMVFPIYPDEVLSAFQYSEERYTECYKTAADTLYRDGEINRKQYDAIINDIDGYSSNKPAAVTGAEYINWQGTGNYANQAVNTYEYVPDWSDGTLVYGVSEADRQGILMHYSKEPGWLNTAGYHIGLEGVTVMVTFDHKFQSGTKLVYDWYIDGETYGDSVTFTVQEDGTTDFEFTFPDPDIRGYSTCELRLWEEGHSHVIAYVLLIQT